MSESTQRIGFRPAPLNYRAPNDDRAQPDIRRNAVSHAVVAMLLVIAYPMIVAMTLSVRGEVNFGLLAGLLAWILTAGIGVALSTVAMSRKGWTRYVGALTLLLHFAALMVMCAGLAG